MSERGEYADLSMKGIRCFDDLFGIQSSQTDPFDGDVSPSLLPIPGAIDCTETARTQQRPKLIAVVPYDRHALFLDTQRLSAGKTTSKR
jgi:hypothetical protein